MASPQKPILVPGESQYNHIKYGHCQENQRELVRDLLSLNGD